MPHAWLGPALTMGPLFGDNECEDAPDLLCELRSLQLLLPHCHQQVVP